VARLACARHIHHARAPAHDATRRGAITQVWEAEKEDFEELAEEELLAESQMLGAPLGSSTSTNGHHLAHAHAHGSATTAASVRTSSIMSAHEAHHDHLDGHAHAAHHHQARPEAVKFLRMNALVHFWPRLVATCFAWVANDFA
jgi:hypothetical protein